MNQWLRFLVTLACLVCSSLRLQAAEAIAPEVGVKLNRSYFISSESNQAYCPAKIRPTIFRNSDSKWVLELDPSQGYLLDDEQSRDFQNGCGYLFNRRVEKVNSKIVKIESHMSAECGIAPKRSIASITTLKLSEVIIELTKAGYVCRWSLK